MSAGTTRHCRRRYRRWTDRAFVGTLDARRTAKLRAHLAECDDCRERYDRLGHADRGLSPSPMSPAAAEQLERVILSEPPAPRRRMWAWSAAAATAATVAVVLLLLRQSPSPGPEMQPRGEHRQALVPGERQPGVRMFCVVDDASGVRVLDEARAVEPSLAPEPVACILDGELQLAYSTPSLRGLTMVAFSRDDAGRTFWYAPRFADAPAVDLTADAVDEPLGWSTRLSVKHHPGNHELFVRFYQRPVTAAEALTGLDPVYELRGRMHIEEASP